MDLESLSNAMEYMKGKVDMIVAALIGDPTDGTKPGLLIRLDRTERSVASLERKLTLVGGALVTVIATIIAAFVIKLV